MSYLPNPTPLTLFCYGFVLLLFYSFVGWCGEMVYCSLGQRKLCEKRGFLNGPLCPIYGHGALVVLWALHGGAENPFVTFILGGILTTIVEYITSYAMEKLFHMRWWDYSRYKFQIHGRVCLVNSTIFGVASVVLCHVIHPPVARWMGRFFSTKAAVPISLVLLAVYLADIVLSVRSAFMIGTRLEKLHAIHDELTAKLEELKAESQWAFEELRAEGADKLEGLWTEGVEALDQRLAAAEAALEELKARTSEAYLSMEARKAETQRAAEARLAEGQRSLEQHRAEAAEAQRIHLEELSALREDLSRRVDEARRDSQERMNALYEGQGFLERRLMNAYPNLHSLRHGEALDKLREYRRARRNARRAQRRHK